MSERKFIRTVAKKLKCIEYKGNMCKHCGAALNEQPWLACFHHRDPTEKSFGIMTVLSSQVSIRKIKTELEKCDLLCVQCHSTLHFSLDVFRRTQAEIRELCNQLNFDDEYFVTEEDKRSFKKLAEAGYSMKDISAAINVSVPTIRKYLPDEKFGNDRKRKITNEQLHDEVSSGLSLRDVAEKYRMGYKTVWKRWRRLNGRNPQI